MMIEALTSVLDLDAQLGLIETTESLITDVRGLIGSGLILVGLVIAMVGSIRKPTMAGIIGACFAGAIIAAIGVVVITLSGLITDEIDDAAALGLMLIGL